MKEQTIAIRNKVICLGVFFSILLLAVATRAVYLQVIKRAWLTEKAESQYFQYLVNTGKRGTIYDANHQELAVSLEVMSIGAFPNRMENIPKQAKAMARILNMDAGDLRKRLEGKASFIWVKRKVSPKDVQEIKNLKIAGLEYHPEFNRYYPNKGLAAQVIGIAGTDEQGLEGLEFYYNRELEATSDKLIVTKDAKGNKFDSTGSSMTGYSGNNLVLTLDKRVQFIAEEALKDAAEEFQARNGMAVVMDPDTGALLAVAHYPEFNPNIFGKYNNELWRNRAVTDAFEPGSTMKVFLAAAALDSGVCSTNSIFFCENGTYQIGPNKVNDTHKYDWLSLPRIVKVSSNIGAVKISEVMGKKRLYTALTDFGFGRKTGIDFPAETSGILSNYNTWRTIDTGNISFGQGVSVSAVQLLSAVSAIANGGTLHQPYLVKSIESPDGTIIREYGKARGRRVIGETTAGQVKRIMASVVTEGGTGENAALSRYTVCGKTGTAQKIDPDGTYSNKRFTSSFVGFAPIRHPKVAVLVILDEPRVDHYGGVVAAPAFRKIVHETLNYMNVEPETDSSDATILLAQRNEAKR